MTKVCWSKMFLIFVFILFSFTLNAVVSDSFFGTSYVRLPLTGDSSAVTNIGLRFRTSRTKGLLLYAFSQDNLFIIRLRESKAEAVIGSQEFLVTLQSRRRPKLNNLRWHTVNVTLATNHAVLFVDGDEKDSQSMPQDVFNLETVYVGGTGEYESEHLSRADKYFRGCLEDVTVGNINVLASSRTEDGAVYHDITEECSVEFEAGMDDPISFVKETAFVLFPKWHIQVEGSFSCWIRTSAPLGLLMFSYKANEFIAAEISAGCVRVLVQSATDSDIFTALSHTPVNDGTWHFVKIDITLTYLQISIDYEPEQFLLSYPFHKSIDFLGTLYVGGVIHRARTLAFDSGLRSVTHASTGGSLKGCLQDVELNGVHCALGDSHVTHGIQIECLYEFPCTLDPCEENEMCIEIGPTDHTCECTGGGCLTSSAATEVLSLSVETTTALSSSTGAMPTSEPSASVHAIFTIEPLSVLEGGGTKITPANIQLNIELRTYRLRPSQLLFRIVQIPQFGRIENNVLGRKDSRVQFTFLDLQTGKISYVHDGSENFVDHLVFNASINTRNDEITIPAMTGYMNFSLPIVVTPINDPPQIVIADGNTFRMIKYTKRILRSEFIHANDPDTVPSAVVFTIVSQQGNVGFFEHNRSSGQSITEFTQEDITEGNIAYVHTGPSLKSRIVLRAADGESKSDLVSIRIDAAELVLEMVNLTVVRTNPASARTISPSNLNVRTNDPEDAFEVSFLVTNPPRLGDVQKLEESGNWVKTTSFLRTDVQSASVRYIASRTTGTSQVSHDQIGLTASSGTASKPGIFLPIQVVVTSIDVVINTGLTIDVVSEAFITSYNLSSETSYVLDRSPIMYHLIRSPVKGNIIKHLVGELDQGHYFTQQDLEAGLVSYRLREKFHEPFNDTFLFRAIVSNTQTEPQEFVITYFPDSEKITAINDGFAVSEGDSHVLTPSDLFLQTASTTDFTYTVTHAPNNGVLQLLDPLSHALINPNVTSFLNLDITNGALRYTHDDSETASDSFGIAATTAFIDRFGHRKQVNFSGVVNISVELQNDNSPVRLVDKVFKVIKNGRTVLTTDDLLYTDEDSDYDDGELLYQRSRVNIGDLVRTDDHMETVFHFKQKDIAAGKIAFQHRGDREQSRMLYHVFDRDRTNYVVGWLHIHALESFVNVPVNTGLFVPRGESATITAANLTADTNINVKARNIVYHITSGPNDGFLMAEGMAVQQFSQESLNEGLVMYRHNNASRNLSDRFNFTIVMKGLETHGQFNIRVLLASKDKLPHVEKMEPIVVEAGKEVILSRFNLKISHPNNLAREIVYKVIDPPKYGELRLKNEYGIIVSRSPQSQDSFRRRRAVTDVMTFTQQDVSRGHVSYIQTDYSELKDTFSFEVSNGYTTLTNLTMTIDIAPSIVPLDIHNFTVLEERSKTITSNIIKVGHVLYESQEFMVHILESPRHGIIENARQPRTNLKSFSTRDISNEFIYYVHDGSEYPSDRFKIVMNNTEGKHSDVYTVYVKVRQVNDQPPSITVNNGLFAVIGAVTTLTTISLSASDPDTADANLTFTITNPGNGYLAFREEKTQPIQSFSQADIASGQIIFVHQGSRTGGFRFQVSDGSHTTQQQIFSIQASPLLLIVANNTRLSVEPGTIQPITSRDLLVVTNEEPASALSRPVTFTITTQPQSGEIVKVISRDQSGTASFVQISSFTQEDVNLGIIAFRHDNSASVTNDIFRFNVFLPLAKNLSDIEFHITFTFDPSSITPYASSTTPGSTFATEGSNGLINTGTEVEEGGKVIISEADLDAGILLAGHSGYVEYTVSQTPHHGFLSLSGRNITQDGSFTQQELTTARLQYTHDHSDTLSDSFNFTATAKLFGVTGEDVSAPTAGGVFQIHILPVNDRELHIVTASLRMTVIQGERVVFNSRYLNIFDPDNSPSEINFILLNRPSNGMLVHVDNPSSNVRKFTQADVNSDKLEFIHDGGSHLGAFLFRVDDGKHFQIKQFSIDVEPRILALATNSPVILLQGDKSSTITQHNLNLTSNGDKSTSYYNVSLPATFGEIRVNSSAALGFSQRNIEHGVVTYYQTRISSSKDKVRLTLYDDYNVIPNVTLDVIVQPLIDISSINASSGDRTLLLPSHLNATELAIKTSSTPTFEISTSPRFGEIVNSTSEAEVERFTFNDLEQGTVAYRADRVEVDRNETVTDEFTLLFGAQDAQTVLITLRAVIGPGIMESTTQRVTTTRSAGPKADGPFKTGGSSNITITNESDEELMTTGALPLEGSEPEAKAVRKRSSFLIYIALSIVVGLIFLIVILVIIICKRRHRKKGEQKLATKKDLQKTVTAEPVLVSSPPPSTLPDHADSSDLYESSAVTQPMINRPVQSPMVPQVKVTPLGRPPSPVNSYASLTSNGTLKSSAFSHNFNSHDLDSLNHVCSKSPTLKKSQYWV